MIHLDLFSREINCSSMIDDIPVHGIFFRKFALQAVQLAGSPKDIGLDLVELFFHSIDLLMVFILQRRKFFFFCFQFCFHRSLFCFDRLSCRIQLIAHRLLLSIDPCTHLLDLFFLFRNFFTPF